MTRVSSLPLALLAGEQLREQDRERATAWLDALEEVFGVARVEVFAPSMAADAPIRRVDWTPRHGGSVIDS